MSVGLKTDRFCRRVFSSVRRFVLEQPHRDDDGARPRGGGGVRRFYLIMRMVYMFVFHGVEEDIRSDNEEEEEATANGSEKKAVENGRPPAYEGGRANDGKKTKTT